MEKFGKTYYWCSKCNSWNLTHTTTQHVSKAELQEQRRAAGATSANTANTNLNGSTTTEGSTGNGGISSNTSSLTSPPPTIESHLASYNLQRQNIRGTAIRDGRVSFGDMIRAGRSAYNSTLRHDNEERQQN